MHRMVAVCFCLQLEVIDKLEASIATLKADKEGLGHKVSPLLPSPHRATRHFYD